MTIYYLIKMPYNIVTLIKLIYYRSQQNWQRDIFYDFYKSAQNIQIPASQSMVSKLQFTCLFYFVLYDIIYFNIRY